VNAARLSRRSSAPQRTAWLLDFTASATPVQSAHARREIAEHLAEALVRDFHDKHGINQALRSNPSGDSTDEGEAA
jgi:hypothetical protein